MLFVIGILVVIFLPQFTDGLRSKGEAELMAKAVNVYFTNIKTIADSCNISTTAVIEPTNSYTTLTGVVNDSFTTVIASGELAVSSTYNYCYK